jgi:amidase
MLRHSLTCFVLALSLSLGACSEDGPPPAPYAVEEVALSQISADLAAGHTTSVEVTKAYIARIETFDHALNSVILVAPDALDQAAASDARRAAGQALGPLDGVPVLFKDNIDAVGMPTTAGSYALEANVPAQDSEVVRRLRAAGTVIFGKTNLSQFAGFRTRLAFNGSTVGGGPHNPYDLTRDACGSSNGSGVAGAASFAAATIGTETSGSVTCPSSFTGLVGVKPSIALVSRRGIVPISLTQDTAGPMTRTVADTAMLLTVMAGSDPGDPWSADADVHKTDYMAGLNDEALRGARLGVVRLATVHYMANFDVDEKTQGPFDAALEVLVEEGAELVEIPSAIFEDLTPEMRIILLYEFKEDINAYLAGTPQTVTTRTLADLIAFSKTDPRENMHGVNIFEDAEATTGGRQNPDYIKTLEYAKRVTQAEGIDGILSEYNVSALVALTNGPAQPIVPDGTDTGYVVDDVPKGSTPPNATAYAAIAGYPHVTVPMGLVDGLPVGLSFIGPMWTDQMLVSLGYAYEQASHMRVPPPQIAPVASNN